MAVGVGLAFVDLGPLQAATMAGLSILAMVTLGVMPGRVLGNLIGRRARRHQACPPLDAVVRR